MRIGILGGTFNPVHNGHIYIAKKFLKKLNLDRIIFVPVNTPPHKPVRGNASAHDRLAMLKNAVKGEKKFSVSPFELKKKSPSYSINTARYFRKKYGRKTEIFFLIGADSLAGLGKWEDIKKLLGFVRFAAVPREGYGLMPLFADVITIRVPKKNISSTKIRRLIAAGKPVKNLVPGAVLKYIRAKGLYS